MSSASRSESWPSWCGPASWVGTLDEVLDGVFVVAVPQRGGGELFERAPQVADVGGEPIGPDDPVLPGALAVVEGRVGGRDQASPVGGVTGEAGHADGDRDRRRIGRGQRGDGATDAARDADGLGDAGLSEDDRELVAAVAIDAVLAAAAP